MKVKYASSWLATGGKFSAQDVTLNGAQAVQPAPLFRAVVQNHYGRGNKSDTFSFAVRPTKSSLRTSERFILAHLADLPSEGQIEVVCGSDDDAQSFFLVDAVLVNVERSYLGLSPAIRYTFVGGLWTENGDTIISEEGDVIRGKVALTEGDTEKQVTYLASLGAPPTVVQCWIVPPDGGDFIDCKPRKTSIDTDGFIAVPAAAIPGAGYDLHWTIVK